MPNLILTFSDNGTFPDNFNSDPEGLKDAIISSLQATINSDNLVLGKIGGTMPTTNVGPWLNGKTWFSWNGTAYTPTILKVGNSSYQVTLLGNPTANRTVTFQNKDGTIALTSDIYSARPTKILGGPTANMDWSQSNSFYILMTANVNCVMTNSYPGQETWLVAKSLGNFDLFFPSTVFWDDGGVPPNQTASGSDFYIFKNVGGAIYGRVLPNYS